MTTKEGWRRYVEHETIPPKLLPATERAEPTGEERARADESWREYHADPPLVNTPTIRKVMSTARLLIQLNRHQVSARRGVILSGASGTGRTTALTQLGRAHELATEAVVKAVEDRQPVRSDALQFARPRSAPPVLPRVGGGMLSWRQDQ
ncbi:hypothetical protein [Streptomyces sp. NPDC049040]|uniref:hypothetical protein n=1 Tax=Streptomyces sp. NPDC049040 TaxID=3365593 RepID=UPI003710BFF2